VSVTRPCVLALLALTSIAAQTPSTSDWLGWSKGDAELIGRSMVARGRIGGGRRLLNTERARSYKVTATWLTPQVLRASTRVIQIRDRLSNDQAKTLLSEAEHRDRTVIMIELDPDEGSGVIPLEWEAFFQPRGSPARAVAGTKIPAARDVKVFAGVSPRNYDYDRFWVEFPTRRSSGESVFDSTDREAELIIRIYDREGTVRWPVPRDLWTQ